MEHKRELGGSHCHEDGHLKTEPHLCDFLLYCKHSQLVLLVKHQKSMKGK